MATTKKRRAKRPDWLRIESVHRTRLLTYILFADGTVYCHNRSRGTWWRGEYQYTFATDEEGRRLYEKAPRHIKGTNQIPARIIKFPKLDRVRRKQWLSPHDLSHCPKILRALKTGLRMAEEK